MAFVYGMQHLVPMGLCSESEFETESVDSGSTVCLCARLEVVPLWLYLNPVVNTRQCGVFSGSGISLRDNRDESRLRLRGLP